MQLKKMYFQIFGMGKLFTVIGKYFPGLDLDISLPITFKKQKKTTTTTTTTKKTKKKNMKYHTRFSVEVSLFSLLRMTYVDTYWRCLF